MKFTKLVLRELIFSNTLDWKFRATKMRRFYPNRFVKSIKEIPIPPSRKLRKNDKVTFEEEEKLLRTAIGQLNWVTTQTQPDLSYVELSMITDRATVDHLFQANKVFVSFVSLIIAGKLH